MSDVSNLKNSIWPNGVKKVNGYAVYTPLGENKVDIPTNIPQWPKGDKLVSPFVYKDNKIVGFCDSKAMINTSNNVITMPYKHIEIDLSSIEKDTIQIHAPKATTKKVMWLYGEQANIVDVNYKYKGCKTIDDVISVDSDYKNDIVNGTWTEILYDLENGRPSFVNGNESMFEKCSNLTTFTSDLSSLTNGERMFNKCFNLETFISDLSSLETSDYMFSECTNLTSFNCSDLSSLKTGYYTFQFCSKLSSFEYDLPSLTNGYSLLSNCSSLTSFNSDLSSLECGHYMFDECTGLISFDSDLPSLMYANQMFKKCKNLSTFDINLPSLTEGYEMFYGCTALSSFTSELPSLTNGKWMFYDCKNLNKFDSDLSSLECGHYMFINCTALSTFDINLHSLTEGNCMFYCCENLTSFNSNLHSLTNGVSMFYECTALSTFTSELPSLTNATNMFYKCENLSTFDINLPSLTNGNWMFARCENLTSFNSDLHSLGEGINMFYDCSNLTTFTSQLSSLTNGESMFYDCKLDASSVKNIIDTINTVSSKTLLLGMGCDNTTEDSELFAQEVGYSDMSFLLAALQSKGWSVTTQYNGRPTTTYTLRRPTEDTLPIYAKLEEVILPTEEEIALAKENGERITTPHYEYTSEDGSKYFNISWFHETTGSTEGYTQFNSLEEAIESFGVI